MQGWHYGKGLVYYKAIFRLTKLAFPGAHNLPCSGPELYREKISFPAGRVGENPGNEVEIQ